MSKVLITKLTGGGQSWYYAVVGRKVLGSAREDDKAGMARLRAIQEGS